MPTSWADCARHGTTARVRHRRGAGRGDGRVLGAWLRSDLARRSDARHGLQKASIYKAFGDKHAPFLCALQRYLDKMYEAQHATLAGARSPRAALRAWLDRLIEAAPAQGGSCRGCLAVNTLVELGPHDEQARAILETHFGRMRALLMEQIRRGQERGEIRADIDAGRCARFLMTMVAGLLGSLKARRANQRRAGWRRRPCNC
jgi:AcrR family transcriptional regulator